MKLTARRIKETEFTVEDKGYSQKEVDEFLKRVLEDYEEKERQECMIDGDCSFYHGETTIQIYSNFDGELTPSSIKYDGTIQDWMNIKNKGIFENVPCINCTDGQYIQKL